MAATTSGMTYMDQMVTMQSMIAVQKVFEKGDITFRNIVLMLFLVCFDGIRKHLMKVLEQLDLVTWVKTKYDNITSFRFQRRRPPQDLDTNNKWIPYITLKFEPSLTFWQSALEDTSSNKKATITYMTTSEKSFQQTNMFEYTLTETYANVAIIGPDFEAYFKDSLSVVSTTVNGHTSIKSITLSSADGSMSGFRDYPNVTCFSDMLPFPVFAKEFKNLVIRQQDKNIEKADNYQAGFVSEGKTIENVLRFMIYNVFEFTTHYTYISPSHEKFRYLNRCDSLYSSPVVDIYMEMLPTLLKKYKNWNISLGVYELYYMLSVCSELLKNERDTNKHGVWKTKNKPVFGCDLSKAFDKLDTCLVCKFVSEPSTINAHFSQLPDSERVKKYLNALFLPDSQSYTNNQGNNHQPPSNDASSSVILYGNLQSWIAYVQELSTNSRMATSSTTTPSESQVYILKVADDIITEEVPNPAYTEWETYMEKLEKLKTSVQAAPPLPPNKTITNTKIVKKVVTEHINNIHKDMSNLYLRREDKRKLLSCLTQYHQNKTLMKELGIPNKLGIMLYGEPGTGKSSTISAIASFLNKNIYYVQMNDVKSNAELMMLFSHVTKNCANAGIIVMEDIDAMTNVVHKRTTTPNNTHQQADDALTLEFFLNILQGSLTTDDTIFITTTNHIECLDPAFYRDGRFDVKIEMRAANHYQISSIFERFFKRNVDQSILTRIPEFKYTPASFIARFREFLLEPEADDKDILSVFMI